MLLVFTNWMRLASWNNGFIALADAHVGEAVDLILTVELADVLCTAFACVLGGVDDLIAELA